MAKTQLENDRLGEILEEWRRARPGIDVSAMEVVPRILRLAYFWDDALQELNSSLGLQKGWLDVLSALRRSQPPHRLPATRLARSVLLTSGGMTARLDRMEEAGLIRRLPDPADRRAVLVELTARGRRAIDAAIDAQPARCEPLLSALTASERLQFIELLRRQLLAFEHASG